MSEHLEGCGSEEIHLSFSPTLSLARVMLPVNMLLMYPVAGLVSMISLKCMCACQSLRVGVMVRMLYHS